MTDHSGKNGTFSWEKVPFFIPYARSAGHFRRHGAVFERNFFFPGHKKRGWGVIMGESGFQRTREEGMPLGE